jgi:hypothetical protein
MTRRVSLLIILLALSSASCGDSEPQGPACEGLDQLPQDIALPDGGDLLLWQTASGDIAGTEKDVFHMQLDCRPQNGFNVTVEVTDQGQADIELSYDIAETQLTVDTFGPGIGEGSILKLGSVPVPADLDIGVSSKNQQPCTYTINVIPDPLPE